MSPSSLLNKLLDYVLEQDKEIDPRGFKLQSYKGFLKGRPDLQGLPGVDFDIKLDGDHIWMRVARLEAKAPPALPAEQWKGVIVVSDNPEGGAPRVDETTLKSRILAESQTKPADQQPLVEAQWRSSSQQVLAQYAPLWSAWAAGEIPRRKTISLYGDLFAIKHQLESEETAKPHELVWGVGVAAWKLNYAERAGSTRVDFQYPLLTQAMELVLDETTLAIALRPGPLTLASSLMRLLRACFRALRTSSVLPVRPLPRCRPPRDSVRPGQLRASPEAGRGNLHEKGRFVNGIEAFPIPTDELVVSDSWVVLSRPRPNNYLHEDIERLKQRLADNCKIPLGPLALVTPPSDQQMTYEPVAFRGLSGYTGGAGAKGEPREPLLPLAVQPGAGDHR